MLPSGGIGLYVLPRSLHSVANVRAPRTEEQIGHSSPFGFAQGRRDDRRRRGEGPLQKAAVTRALRIAR